MTLLNLYRKVVFRDTAHEKAVLRKPLFKILSKHPHVISLTETFKPVRRKFDCQIFVGHGGRVALWDGKNSQSAWTKNAPNFRVGCMVVGNVLQNIAANQDIETASRDLRHPANIEAEVDIAAVEIGRHVFGGCGLNLSTEGSLRREVQDVLSGNDGGKAKVVKMLKCSSKKAMAHLAPASGADAAGMPSVIRECPALPTAHVARRARTAQAVEKRPLFALSLPMVPPIAHTSSDGQRDKVFHLMSNKLTYRKRRYTKKLRPRNGATSCQ